MRGSGFFFVLRVLLYTLPTFASAKDLKKILTKFFKNSENRNNN